MALEALKGAFTMTMGVLSREILLNYATGS